MPQTNKKEEWVQHYNEAIKGFYRKKSGWTVSKSAGSIKLEVRTNGKKESRTLPYRWNEQEFAVAVEEIKQIYKRYKEGNVHTLAAACDITATSNSITEANWKNLVESYREFVPYSSNKTWIKSYYVEPKQIGKKRVLPVLNQVINLMQSYRQKKPANGTELMMQALRTWEQGSRSRQIARRVYNNFLQWAVCSSRKT